MANNIFKKVKVNRPKRSTFNLSHTNMMTTTFGNIVPFLCEETVPGDTWKVGAKTNTIFAPLSAPCLTNMYGSIHYFFVPMRLLWDDYEDFITNNQSTMQSYHIPTIDLLTSTTGSPYTDNNKQMVHGTLADYLGYPTSEENKSGGGMRVSALPFRAYQRIWDEYYRDENLTEQISQALPTHSNHCAVGSSEFNLLTKLRKRCYAKDYFTSALPWTQKGPQQAVPITGVAEMKSGAIAYNPDWTSMGGDKVRLSSTNDSQLGLVSGDVHAMSGAQSGVARIDNSEHLSLANKEVSINGLNFTINEFRRANAIQRWFERNARAGSRYVESLLSHFGVISSDARIQRPEFLGGNTTRIKVSDVIQTSASDNVTPQGNRSGLAYSFQSSGFTRTFEERGYIIGLFSILPESSYMEGCRKMFRRSDVFDFYFPEFAHLGEQEILNSEVALRGTNKDEVFGYAPRYADYKYIPSTIHGDLKNMNGLGDWTLARHYAEQPTLSTEFVQCDTKGQDLDRIFAVQAESSLDQMLVAFDIKVKARRPMPYLPEPSLT